MIRARGITVRAGDATLLAEIDLEIRGGEVVALFGANGAGKSTLLSVLAGDRTPDRGRVELAGVDVRELAPRDRALRRAVLRQQTTLTAAYTALEVVRLGREDLAIAKACLAEVELLALADRFYPTLSGGEQQRVQLARVLAQLHGRRDAALFLDEPGAALDLRQQALIETIVRAVANRGHAVVLVAHDPKLIARCADRVIVLHRGRVLADAPPAEALAVPVVARAFEVDAGWLATRS